MDTVWICELEGSMTGDGTKENPFLMCTQVFELNGIDFPKKYIMVQASIKEGYKEISTTGYKRMKEKYIKSCR